MSDTYKLQLRHGAEAKNFSTRDEVTAYIQGQLQYGGVSLLPYEPVLFYYGEEGAKNAIIMVGLPEGQTNDGKTYFIIDTADLKEQIKALDEKYDAAVKALQEEDTKIWEAVNKEIADRIAADETEAEIRAEKDAELEKKDEELQIAIDFAKADLMSVIEACGLIYNERLAEGRVSYQPDLHDEVIRDAKDVTEAIDKVSKFAIKLAKDMKFSVKDTDTVSLTITPNEKEGGNILTADVNIAGTEGLSKKNFDNNIIGKTSEGLYASASLEPSLVNPNKLIFKTSGYVDGQFKVDAFETEVDLTAYKGDNGKNTGINVSVDTDKNIISAELNLSSDKNNILKLEDGEYVVEGVAKNIKYGETTVAGALKNQANRLDEIEDSIEFVKAIDIEGNETATTSVNVDKSSKGDFTVSTDVKLSSDRSIIVANGGLQANVSATFREGTSTLIINVGNNEYAINLSALAVSVLERAEYDSVTEEIVLIFRVGDTTKTLRIPVGSLIHDLEVYDTDTIDLTLTSVSGGPNHLSAELKVDKAHTDNILTVTSNGAYVSKSFITEAVKAETEERKDADKELKSKIEEVNAIANANKEAIAEEKNVARAAEKANADAIAQEIKDARKAEELNANAIAENKIAIKAVETAVDAEEGRAKSAEQANANAIIAEETRAKEAETKNANAISSEIERAIEKEGDILEKIGGNTEKINENKTAITAEVERATKNETLLQGKIDSNKEAIAAETNRAQLAETSNANAISAEVNRATVAETELKASFGEAIDNEKKRAMASEAVLTENINNTKVIADSAKTVADNVNVELVKEIERATNAENTNSIAITKEINDARKAETEIKDNLTTAIATETKRAEEKETDLLEKINQNTRNIETVSSNVNNIELRSEGDMAYALYVNNTKHGEFSIPKDQFLKSANYNPTTKELIFVFETRDGEVTTKVSVADLVDTYEAGSGLVLNGKTFSVDSTIASKHDITVSINAECNRAIGVENGLKSRIEILEGETQQISILDKTLSDEIIRAKSAESANAQAIANETERAKEKEEDLLTKANKNEADIVTIKENLNQEILRASDNENTIKGLIETETVRANSVEKHLEELINNEAELLATKANSNDVYTKSEILEKFANYTTTDEINSKLSEKVNVSELKAGYATKEDLSNLSSITATKEDVNSADKALSDRIKTNEDALGEINLTYNAATSELTYVDTKGNSHIYKLYSGSLIKKGEFNPLNNSIVLTIENAGIESQITIPVSELLSDLSNKITENTNDISKINNALEKLAKDWEVKDTTTVELVKSNLGEKDTLSANVRIATSNKQAIQSSDSGLYVSNDLEDYTCVFGSEGTISGQDAISKLLDKTKAIASDIEHLNIEELRAQVNINTTDIANLKTKVGDLTNRVIVNEGNITKLENVINTYEAKFEIMNNEIIELRELINKIIKGDVGELIAEIEKIKKVTGYPDYTNIENMSVRIDNLENSGSYDDLAEKIRIINEEKIGPSDGSVDGSIWHELNNIVDAGNF